MNEKDLRVIKTKRSLSQSLYGLIEKQAFSTITIKQICDLALVHRTTFYKHFHDKYDLLIYLITDLTKDYFSIDLKERINAPFSTIQTTFDNVSGMEQITEKQKDDKDFERTITNYFIRVLQNDIKINVSRISVDSSVPIELIFYVYGSSLYGFMEWMRNHNIKHPAHEIDEIFHKMINIKVKDV